MELVVKLVFFGVFVSIVYTAINYIISNLNLNFLIQSPMLIQAAYILNKLGIFSAINAYISALAVTWAINKFVNFWM